MILQASKCECCSPVELIVVIIDAVLERKATLCISERVVITIFVACEWSFEAS